ncbi:hypothetical protein [Trichlorobacter ammonificans]|uniref:Uncharacterized protein n=1 Tax=Trichlorobacter ammonificans TaxID=2916410 RepID=A0ABM9D7R1_9BACT|nr:hypothetical protein [Trichlorobacter ammonificans]CAH2031196.1 conserved protein of unknown function [Trichlorobacter ammonificans]
MKPVIITILEQVHQRRDWFFDFDGAEFAEAIQDLTNELMPLGIALEVRHNREVVITVNSYADLLNSVKVSSPRDNHHNQCVGHIIGKSEHLHIVEDISKAVRRIAFAPETIAPDAAFRKVCHNCGCGC